MATPMPIPNHIIIWLDQYIGLVDSDEQLKTGVSQQVDPQQRTPDSPSETNIKNLIQFKTNMDQGFENIPKNLKAFSHQDECLECIGESLKNNKKIFFITSGTMGEEIAPKIIEKYPSLTTIYVFCGYYRAHLEWCYGCLDHGVECIMENFHTDLLARLLRDVAKYFTSQGDNELSQSEQLAYSAVEYFTWAKLLLERANNFAIVKLFDDLRYVESRIAYTKQLIRKLSGNNDIEESEESFQ